MKHVVALLAFGAVIALAYAEEVAPAQQVVGDEQKATILREARARARAAEEKAITDPDQVPTYNNFVDAVLRKVGGTLRARNDPLTIRLEKKTGKKGGKKGKKANGKGKKATNKGKKSGKKSAQKKGGKKQGRRHSRDFKIGEEDAEESVPVEEEPAVEEEEQVERQKRDAEFEEDEDEEAVIELDEDEFADLFGDEALSRVERDLDEDEFDEDDDEEEYEEEDDDDESLSRVERDVVEEEVVEEEGVNRAGKPAGRRNAAKKGGRGNGKKGNGKAKRNSKGKGKGKAARGKGKGKAEARKDKKSKKSESSRKGKKSGGRNASKSSKKKKSPARTPRAVVNGFGSLTRFGDVKVFDRQGKREIRTAFRTGPISLKVSKMEGKGNDKSPRTARASTPGLSGAMTLSITSQGKAKVEKLHIEKPTEVHVEGSIGRTSRSDKFMSRSIPKASSVMAKKLQFAVRDVLKDKKAAA